MPNDAPAETPYVDELSAIAEVAALEPPPRQEIQSEATAFVWASVRRWPPLHRSFSLLFKSWLVDESRLVTRAIAELAINAAWVVQGQATKRGRYSTADERAKALEEESRALTRQWWQAMNEHSPERPFSDAMVRNWEEALVGAEMPKGLPKLRGRAEAISGTTFPLQLYDFAYRADCDVTHSNTWSLISSVQGKFHLTPSMAVVNAYSGALLLISAGADALKSDRLGNEARKIRDALFYRMRGARPPG